MFIPSQVASQDVELMVGSNKMPPLKWGSQKALFEVENLAGYPKWIAVDVKVQYKDSFLTPSRSSLSFHLAYPGEITNLTPILEIPGNYGKAEVIVKMYDVIDTLDAILDYQKFYEQKFFLSAPTPDAMYSYLEQSVTLPPMVEVHPDFDFDFSRILMKMVSEGKKALEIASLANADIDYVNSQVLKMQKLGYLKSKEDSLYLVFPYITVAEAEEAKAISDKLSDSLVKIITANIPQFDIIVDSLVLAKAMSNDPDEFFNKGGVLHNKFITINALALWDKLGRYFVTRSAPFSIYDNTDPCNAYIPYYMYATEGGDYFNGNQYYALNISGRGYDIYFGDSIPTFDCEKILKVKKRRPIATIQYVNKDKPEKFMYDSTVTSPAVRALVNGTDSLLVDVYRQLFDLTKKYNHGKVSFGYRYWFWNLTATRTTRKLIESGIVERSGNGQYHIISMAGM